MPKYQLVFVELQIATGTLQVAVDAGGAAHAPKRIDHLYRRAPYSLVHAALKAALLPRKGVSSQLMPKNPSLKSSIEEIQAFWLTLKHR